MNESKRIKELEHKVEMLTHKLQIAELEVLIANKKFARYREQHPPTQEDFHLWRVTTPGTQIYTESSGVKDLTSRIQQAMNKNRAKGQEA